MKEIAGMLFKRPPPGHLLLLLALSIVLESFMSCCGFISGSSQYKFFLLNVISPYVFFFSLHIIYIFW